MGRKVSILIAGMLVGALIGAMAPVGAHHRDDKFRRRIAKLEKKTQHMDRAGFYNGIVSEWQVVSYQGCEDGDDALWVDTEVVPELTYLWCAAGPYGPEPPTGQMAPKMLRSYVDQQK